MFSSLRLNCATRIWILIGVFVVVVVVTMIFYRKKVQKYHNISEKLIESNDRERQKRDVVKANTLRLDAVHDREFIQKRKKNRPEADDPDCTLLDKEKIVEISTDPNEQLSDVLFQRDIDMEEEQTDKGELIYAESETASESDDDFYSLFPAEERHDASDSASSSVDDDQEATPEKDNTKSLCAPDKEKVDKSLRNSDERQVNNGGNTPENKLVNLNQQNITAEANSEEKMGNEMSNECRGLNKDVPPGPSMPEREDDTSKTANWLPAVAAKGDTPIAAEKEKRVQPTEEAQKEHYSEEKTDVLNNANDDRESETTLVKAPAAIKTSPLFSAINKALHAYPVFSAAAKELTDEIMPPSIVTETPLPAEPVDCRAEDDIADAPLPPPTVTETPLSAEPVVSRAEDDIADAPLPSSAVTETPLPAEPVVSRAEDDIADASLPSSTVIETASSAEPAVSRAVDKLTDAVMSSSITANETADTELAGDLPELMVKNGCGNAPQVAVDNQPESPGGDQLASQVKDSEPSDVEPPALATLPDAKITDALVLESDVADQETKKVNKRQMPTGLMNAESHREPKSIKKTKALKVETKRR